MVEKETKLEDEVILKVNDSFEKSLDGDDSEELEQKNLIGSTIAGHYKIESLLGAGGMSSVYRVEHQLIDCHRAIKILKSNQATDRGAKDARRFQQEAQAVCSLEHENIVRVHEFGIEQQLQKPYLVMDLVEGQTLAEIIKKEGKLSEDRALRLTVQIAEALAHAHSKGVIHRDIKPANVIVEKTTAGESCKIVDFGIAKMSRSDETQSLTQTGDIFGSPLYMSPEQCLGHKVDHRSDLYSLGCLLYELLKGNPPHKGQSSLETLHFHLVRKPEDVSASMAVKAILDTLLKKEAHERYQDAISLLADLHRVLGQSPAARNVLQPPPQSIPSPGNTDGKSLSNSQRAYMTVGAVFLILAQAITGLFLIQSMTNPNNSTTNASAPPTQNQSQVSPVIAPSNMLPFTKYDNRLLFDGPVLNLHQRWGQELKFAALTRIRAAEASTSQTKPYELREAHRTYADLLLTDGETDKALAEYEKALAAWTQFGGDEEALKPAIGAADALMDKEQIPQACDRYLRVLDDLDRRNINNTVTRGSVLLKLGICKHALGDEKAAREYIDDAIACAKPLLSSSNKADQISAYVLTGDALMTLNRLAQAAQMFAEAVKIAEDALHNHGYVMRSDNVLLMRLKMAEAYSLADDTTKAERALQRVLSESGIEMPHHRELKVRALYALALNYSKTSPEHSRQKFEEAIAEARKLPQPSTILAMLLDGLASKLPPNSARAKELLQESKKMLQQPLPWSARPLTLENTVEKKND